MCLISFVFGGLSHTQGVFSYFLSLMCTLELAYNNINLWQVYNKWCKWNNLHGSCKWKSREFTVLKSNTFLSVGPPFKKVLLTLRKNKIITQLSFKKISRYTKNQLAKPSNKTYLLLNAKNAVPLGPFRILVGYLQLMQANLCRLHFSKDTLQTRSNSFFFSPMQRILFLSNRGGVFQLQPKKKQLQYSIVHVSSFSPREYACNFYTKTSRHKTGNFCS